MLFKNEMWIRRTCLRMRLTGVINRARTVGGVNAGPYGGRGRVYAAHAPAPFMGEGSRTISVSIF